MEGTKVSTLGFSSSIALMLDCLVCCQILHPRQLHARSFSYSYGKQHADYRILSLYNLHILSPAHKIQQLYSIYFSSSTTTWTAPVHLCHAELCYIKSGSRIQTNVLSVHLACTYLYGTHPSIVLESKVLSRAVIHSIIQMFFYLQRYFFLSKGNEARTWNKGKKWCSKVQWTLSRF